MTPLRAGANNSPYKLFQNNGIDFNQTGFADVEHDIAVTFSGEQIDPVYHRGCDKVHPLLFRIWYASLIWLSYAARAELQTPRLLIRRLQTGESGVKPAVLAKATVTNHVTVSRIVSATASLPSAE